MRVLIAGAGIAGLTTALSLHAAGIEAQLVDSAPELRPLGVGINLLPHAVRELTELGLGPHLEATGIAASEQAHFDRHGGFIWSEPRGRGLGYAWPQYSIRRGELRMILLAAVRERLGPQAVRTGTAVTGFTERDGAVKFVAYPIARRGADRVLINWVAEVMVGGSAPPVRPDWNREGRLAEALPHFAGWTFGWLDIPDLMRRTAEILSYPMIDRDPLPSWGRGRVTLAGDAAHPMYPIGSNGGSQAIVDARVLARCLSVAASAEEGLAAYEAERLAAVNEIVLANRSMPVDAVVDMVSARAPDGFERIEDVLSPAELAALRDAYRATSLQDVAALNARPSLGGPLFSLRRQPAARRHCLRSMRFRPAARAALATVILLLAGCAAPAPQPRGSARQVSAAVPASGVFGEVPGDNPALTDTGGRVYLSWDLPSAAAPGAPGAPVAGLPRVVLARIDTRTGAIEATNTFSPGFVGPPLAAAGALWVTDSTSAGELLLRLDPVALMVTGALTVSATRYPVGSHVAYAGGWLWVDGAGRLLRVSPTSVEPTAVVPLPGAFWSDVGASPDGSVLVVSEQGRTGAVQRRDPRTGALLAAHLVAGVAAAAIDGFAGSGVWITVITGMSAYAERLSLPAMTPGTARPVAASGGLSVRVADGRLWVTDAEVAGPAMEYCADPATGRRVAALPVTGVTAGALLAVVGHVLYYAAPARHGTGWRVAPVPIPAACG